MNIVLLLVHLFVTLLLIGIVLIQRSEGGGLGIGTSQGMGSFMSGRGTANLLTRTTAILGGIFMALSMALAILSHGPSAPRSILDLAPATSTTPAPGTATPAPAPAGATPGVPVPGETAPAAPAPAGAAPAATAPAATAPAPAGTAPASSAPAGASSAGAAPAGASSAGVSSSGTAPAAPSAPTN